MTPDPIDLTADGRAALGRAAVEWVLQQFAGVAAMPVYPAVTASGVHDAVAEALPIEPQDPAVVLRQFAGLAALGRNNGHPRMFGYVQSSASFAGVIGDFLASAANQNVTSWRSAPAATTVERQVVEWIAEMVGFDRGGEGLLLSGGSMANFAGLAVALRASTDIDLNQRGVAALAAPPRLYAPAGAHMSIAKASALLGLGRDAIAAVAVDGEGRIDPIALDRQLARDAGGTVHRVCVVANAGDVNTGAVDPLDAIADVCGAHGIWLHVDGSYGGFAAKAPRAPAALAGLRRADSLALDPHKWLFAPLDAGCLLVRNGVHLRRTFAHGASYVDVIADPDMSTFAYWDVGPELSRRFRALKIWFALKCHGARALIAAIDDNIAVAADLAAAVDASPDFERMAPAPLSIVCFRYRPASLGAGSVDEFNRRLLLEVQRGGESYLSNTMIGNAFALRACIVNFRTTARDVARLLADVRAAAARVTG